MNINSYKQLEVCSSTHPGAFTVGGFLGRIPIGRTKFYAEVAAGRIHVLKAGRRTLVPTSEVQAYLDRLAREGGAQ